MHASAATEVELDASHQPNPKEPVDAERNPRTSASTDAKHFSPDPYRMTDRYRLVTPYRLPKHD